MRFSSLGALALAGAVACAGGTTTTPDDDASTQDGAGADARLDASGMDVGVPDSPASCSNGTKDGSETDVDCGGALCPKCVDGKTCTAPTDCAAGSCFVTKCGARMWTEESSNTNLAIPGNQTWIPVGLTLSPTLYAPSLVALRWTGTLRFGGGGNGLCHVGQRFVIDGTPTGHVTWGDAIMVQKGATRWHESFTDEIAVQLAPGVHTVSVEMTNANGYATCNLDGDGGAGYDRSRLAAAAFDPQNAWYSESNAETGALAAGGAWTNVPGAFTAFTLGAKAHVQMALTGTQLVAGAGSGHCAYRFVLDGAGLGDVNHGQAISVGDVVSGWWAPVALKYGADIMPGAHAIQAQVRNSSAAGGTCNAGQGNNPYARLRMLVTASPPGGSTASAESSGGAYILPSTSQWTAVGGLATTFNLAAETHVQLEMAGTERTMSGSGHCAWRFVVDNMPLGDPNHGQAINVGDGATTWWTATPLLWGQSFTAGMHTVSVEVRNSSNSGDCGTNGDGLAYGRARLLVRGP